MRQRINRNPLKKIKKRKTTREKIRREREKETNENIFKL
jgi:hypothetical protein